MKKIAWLLILIMALFVIAACVEGEDPDDVFQAVLSIDDITLIKGEVVNIDYTIAPAGTFGVVSFEILSQTPENVISITGTTLTAIETGTATVKATATNMPGASQTFTAEKTFTVTVNPIPVEGGQYVRNGSFEYGLTEWTVGSLYGPDAYGTQVVDNYPHTGDAALNLWFDDDLDGLGDALDITLTQVLENVPAGTYLFSLWYQGTTTSLTMTARIGETVLASETFSGYDYTPVPENQGYVHYGIEVEVTTEADVTIEIHIEGPDEVWGYVDTVSFMAGTIDDLETVPPAGEEGYVNFIEGGGFSTLAPWTVEITGPATSKQANLSQGRLAIWANGVATFKIHQEMALADFVYNLVIYLNGGVPGDEFNVDEAYIYVQQGETLLTLDLTPEGWGTGEMKRIELSDLDLEGTYEVGIYINFTSGTNNWINLDNFTLWSYSIPHSPEDMAAAATVDDLINDLPDVNDLTLDDEDDVLAARAAYEALTEVQKAFVTTLARLLSLENALEDLQFGAALAQFNTVGDFTSPDWTLSAIGWTAVGGSAWTRDNWPHTGAQNYDMFHHSSALTGSIAKTVTGLEANTYMFAIYMAGGGLTSVTVTAGGESESFTVTGSYTKYDVVFVYDGVGDVEIMIEVVRPDTDGWINLDTASLAVVVPDPLDEFNAHGDFVSPDWSMAAIGWTVVGGNMWTEGSWTHSGSQKYDMFKDVSVLEASISKTVSGLAADTYVFEIYMAGGSLTSVTITIGSASETFVLTGDWAPYELEFVHDGSGDVVILIEVVRPDTSGWINLDTASLAVDEEA